MATAATRRSRTCSPCSASSPSLAGSTEPAPSAPSLLAMRDRVGMLSSRQSPSPQGVLVRRTGLVTVLVACITFVLGSQPVSHAQTARRETPVHHVEHGFRNLDPTYA